MGGEEGDMCVCLCVYVCLTCSAMLSFILKTMEVDIKV